MSTRKLRPERVPPNNLEAEESVLGGMMISQAAASEVMAFLGADDFYRASHGNIYDAIRSLALAGKPVDAITTAEELKRRGILEDIGGPLRIHELVELVPTPASAPYYARIVLEKSRLRRICDAGYELARLAEESGADPAEALSKAESVLAHVATADQSEVVRLSDVLSGVLERAERAYQGEPQNGLLTGFRDIDDLLGGLDPGRFYVLAARPGVGKSALAANIARNVAGRGEPVVLFSLEMSRSELVERLCSAESRVPLRSFRRPEHIYVGGWKQITDASERIASLPLDIVDDGATSIGGIRATCRRAKLGDGLGLVIVDYVQLMAGERRFENRQQEVADISRTLKVLAKDLQVPVIALSQLNRQSEYRADKRPGLSDLRESGALEQDADVVAFLFRKEEKDPIEFIVAKHRNGPQGSVKLSFFADFTAFADYSGMAS